MKRYYSADVNALINLLTRLSREGGCIDIKGELRDLIMSLDTSYIGIDGRVCMRSLVPLALKAMEAGGDPERVSLLINWRDFEGLIYEYLERSGFRCVHSVRFSGRRYEIDVLAADPCSGYALAIDCKHWSPGYSKSWKLKGVARSHRAKVELMCRECNIRSGMNVLSKARWVVPVIVTLTTAVRGYYEGSFIVPIISFRDFINRLEYYVDLLSGMSGRVRNECFRSA